MKILELCEFSSGICGVWNRVFNESKLLARKHEVHVFSSNIIKGTNEKAKSYEVIDKFYIHRFPVYFRLGENALFWNFKKKLFEIKPDIIITHVYRHPHSTIAAKIAKKINARCFLVTHAPFVEKGTRNFFLDFFILFYDKFFGKKILNSYDKVIAITKWEIPFLLELGCKKEKIVYIPNGIPEEFFQIKMKKKKRKEKEILFLGRIAQIKNIETLLKAFSLVKKQYNNVKLKIVGPVEKEYAKILDDLIKELKIEVNFTGPIYNTDKKIKIIDEADIFVLPSKREAMPQALLEAMARSKLCISSKTDGGKEIIKEGKNGFLFEIGNEKELAEKILYCLKDKIEIRKEARKTAEKFEWSKIIKEVEKIYKFF